MTIIPLSVFPWLLTAAGITAICTGQVGTGIAMTLLGGAWLGFKFFLKSSKEQES